VIVFDSDVGQKNAFAYYWARSDVELVPGSRFVGLFEADVAKVRSAAESHRRVWLVISHSRDPDGVLRAQIERVHRLRAERDFLGISVLRFQ
jgi:hypothetical protein